MHPHHAVAAAAIAHGIVMVHPHLARALTVRLVKLVRCLSAMLVARRPKVSVVTPTWQRARLLRERCIPSVKAQEYDGETEHIIVSDGPDPHLAAVRNVSFLPRHIPAANRGLAARLRGTELATGELIAYLDDDNAWRPEHLRLLTAALLHSGADFAYSRALCHGSEARWLIGEDPPALGQVDTSMIAHRRELLQVANWQPSTDPADWNLVSRWLAAGVKRVFVPKVTLDYYCR